MNTAPLIRLPLLVAVGCGALTLGRSTSLAGEYEAVSSAVSDGYVRVKLADGSFRDETYAFGDGGRTVGPIRDDSIDHLTFLDVARVASEPLARRSYVPAAGGNPENTKLLIMVYWGTTRGTAGGSDSDGSQKLQSSEASLMSAPPTPASAFTAHCSCDATQLNTGIASVLNGVQQDNMSGALALAAMGGRARREADMRNALLLGYELAPVSASGFALRNRQDDMIAEIEDNRDFVVLKAYDFQDLWKHKKHSLLWVTRLSVRERGTDFRRALLAMVDNASPYFGQESRGLVRRNLPEGYVEVGAVKSLGVLTER